jgi:PilZ domain
MQDAQKAKVDDTGQNQDRRHALMTGAQREERRQARLLTTVPVTIYVNSDRHVGLVRDYNLKGLFVYSDFQPACGDTLSFTLRLLKRSVKLLVVNCRGKVMRVETAGSGAAVGIAVAVEEYEFRRLAQSPSVRE